MVCVNLFLLGNFGNMFACVATMLRMLAEHQPMSPWCWHHDCIHGWVMSWLMCCRTITLMEVAFIFKERMGINMYIYVDVTLFTTTLHQIMPLQWYFLQSFAFFVMSSRISRHVGWYSADMTYCFAWHSPVNRVWQRVGLTFPTFLSNVSMSVTNMSLEEGGSVDTTQSWYFQLQYCWLDITSTFAKPGWVQHGFTFVIVFELIQGGLNKL